MLKPMPRLVKDSIIVWTADFSSKGNATLSQISGKGTFWRRKPGGQPYEKNRATTNTPIIVNASAILSAAPKTSPTVAPTPARAAA